MTKSNGSTVAARRRDAATFAQDLIRRLPRLYQQIPRDPIAIAAYWNIQVVLRDLHIDGILLQTVNQGGGHILVTRRVSTIRQRFTVAHELGHYFHDTTHAVEDVGSGQWLDEREADAFAGALLIPFDDLIQQVAPSRPLAAWFTLEQHTQVISKLARRYAVSHHTLLQYLVDAGLVEDLIPWDRPGPVWRAWERLKTPAIYPS